jgi:Asp-tRNA(Asn)/Glu-tRNA(Gln) amidotransferase A subunit family amidase
MTPQSSVMQAAASCRELRDRLHAFVEIADVPLAGASGPLAGLPIAIKDMIDIAGRAPTLGLAQAPRRVPARNARVFDMLSNAGAVTVAFAQMSPLAYEPSGANPQCGRPLNPWNADYICGGSSSGPAVAVASGCVPLALGSDTAGSLRIPAHCCGITAWKPTHGLVPIEGTMPLAPSLDAIGFLARAASTIVPVAALFAGGDEPHPIHRVAVAHDLTQRSAASIQSSVAAMERTLLTIRRSLLSMTLEPLLAAADVAVMTVLVGEAARANADLIGSGGLDRELKARLEKGLAITDAQLDDARRLLKQLAATEIERLFSATDAILLPVMPHSTPLVVACEPKGVAFAPRTLYALSSFTRFVNALGLPAVSVPAGVDEQGLPIGLQLVGPPSSDRALIALACEIQQACEWHRRLPPVRADL